MKPLHITVFALVLLACVRFGITGGTRRGTPDVTPELAQRGKTWIFVNFHYPAKGKDQPKSDLLGILKQLRDDRAKHHR